MIKEIFFYKNYKKMSEIIVNKIKFIIIGNINKKRMEFKCINCNKVLVNADKLILHTQSKTCRCKYPKLLLRPSATY